MAEVVVLRPGYAYTDAASAASRAGGTITLVLSDDLRMLVDTGGPQERLVLIDALRRHQLAPEQITHVVCTHGHVDHIGNNNLFAQAEFMMGQDYSNGDSFRALDFSAGSISIARGVELLATPGHTSEDISVLAHTHNGEVAIVGDLFENAADLDDEQLWLGQSRNPVEQRRNRARILSLARFIVPGHGDIFATDHVTGTFGQR